MKVEQWQLSQLRPYEQNPRNNDDAVDTVAASIREFGFRQPIVVDENGVIIVGHTRFKAAQKLRLTEVPVHVASGLSAEQIRAYRIADNKSSELAEWDFDLLPVELAALKDANYDIAMLGFDVDELARIMNPEHRDGLTDPDDIPAPPDAATTQPGDLWILGDHRLLCGDSSKPEDLDRLLGGQVIHLVNMDPPYNVKVEPRSNNAIAAGLSSFQGTTHHQSMDVARHPGKAKATQKKLRAKDRPLANDFVSEQEFDRLLDAWVLHLGWVCELCQLPAVPEEARAVFQPGDHLGQDAPRPDPQRLHGSARVVLLRLEGRCGARLPRAQQRHRPVAGQEGESAVDGSPDREARGTGSSGDAVLIAGR
jgi:hypothetical protein